MKKLALLWGLSLCIVVGATRTSPAHTEAAPAASSIMAVDDRTEDESEDDATPADDEGVCAEKGDTCLKGDAPKCCKGLRCVGYVCKK
jgi:hypothetical protein